MSIQLIIGNKNYSSWSLRAWLYLRESGLPFEEIRIPLFTNEWTALITRYTPAARVPVVIDGDVPIWDSLAIFEHLREQYQSAAGWPQAVAARAEARSIAAEMHSGFMAIRDELPQNIRVKQRRARAELSDRALAEIERVTEMWSGCKHRYGADGPWLFGQFSIADVMYAPVALRFVTYEIELPAPAQAFVEAVLGLESIQEWIADSEREPERLDFIDQIVPARESPLSLG